MTAQRRASIALAHAKRVARRLEGSTGVDFGFVYRNGIRTLKRGIRFHVAKKQSPDQLAHTERLPDELHGFECDVLEASYKPHAGGEAGKPNQLSPGVSVCNCPRRATGILGLIVMGS